MAESENVQAPEAPQQETQPIFQMQRCYLKDASLEMPNAPEILIQSHNQEPQVDIQFEVAHRPVAEGLFDVIVLVEGKQAGLFTIANLPAEDFAQITNVLCPSIIYPYLRANLADLMNRANIPPVHLPEVSFEMLYRQRLAQEAEQRKQAETQNSTQQGGEGLS